MTPEGWQRTGQAFGYVIGGGSFLIASAFGHDARVVFINVAVAFALPLAFLFPFEYLRFRAHRPPGTTMAPFDYALTVSVTKAIKFALGSGLIQFARVVAFHYWVDG